MNDNDDGNEFMDDDDRDNDDRDNDNDDGNEWKW